MGPSTEPIGYKYKTCCDNKTCVHNTYVKPKDQTPEA